MENVDKKLQYAIVTTMISQDKALGFVGPIVVSLCHELYTRNMINPLTREEIINFFETQTNLKYGQGSWDSILNCSRSKGWLEIESDERYRLTNYLPGNILNDDDNREKIDSVVASFSKFIARKYGHKQYTKVKLEKKLFNYLERFDRLFDANNDSPEPQGNDVLVGNYISDIKDSEPDIYKIIEHIGFSLTCFSNIDHVPASQSLEKVSFYLDTPLLIALAQEKPTPNLQNIADFQRITEFIEDIQYYKGQVKFFPETRYELEWIFNSAKVAFDQNYNVVIANKFTKYIREHMDVFRDEFSIDEHRFIFFKKLSDKNITEDQKDYFSYLPETKDKNYVWPEEIENKIKEKYKDSLEEDYIESKAKSIQSDAKCIAKTFMIRKQDIKNLYKSTDLKNVSAIFITKNVALFHVVKNMYPQNSSTFYCPEVMLLWRLQTLLSFSRGNISNRFTTQFVAYAMDLYKYNQGTIEKIKTRLKNISNEKGQGLTDEEAMQILSQKKESELIGYEEAIEVQGLVDTEEEREKLQQFADKYLLLGEEERYKYESDNKRKDYQLQKYIEIDQNLEACENEKETLKDKEQSLSNSLKNCSGWKKKYTFLFSCSLILTILGGIAFIAILFAGNVLPKLNLAGTGWFTGFFGSAIWKAHSSNRNEEDKIDKIKKELASLKQQLEKLNSDILSLKNQKTKYFSKD